VVLTVSPVILISLHVLVHGAEIATETVANKNKSVVIKIIVFLAIVTIYGL
jgi:hypothetical protein